MPPPLFDTNEIEVAMLRPPDRLRYDGADYQVTRVEVTPGRPAVVFIVPAMLPDAPPRALYLDPAQLVRLVRTGTRV